MRMQFNGDRLSRFESVARLRDLLFGLEKDLGIDSLTPNELDILYAMRLLSDGDGQVVRSDAIRDHSLCSKIPRPTFHRSLRSLIEKGLVERAPKTRARAYVLASTELRPGN